MKLEELFNTLQSRNIGYDNHMMPIATESVPFIAASSSKNSSPSTSSSTSSSAIANNNNVHHSSPSTSSISERLSKFKLGETVETGEEGALKLLWDPSSSAIAAAPSPSTSISTSASTSISSSSSSSSQQQQNVHIPFVSPQPLTPQQLQQQLILQQQLQFQFQLQQLQQSQHPTQAHQQPQPFLDQITAPPPQFYGVPPALPFPVQFHSHPLGPPPFAQLYPQQNIPENRVREQMIALQQQQQQQEEQNARSYIEFLNQFNRNNFVPGQPQQSAQFSPNVGGEYVNSEQSSGYGADSQQQPQPQATAAATEESDEKKAKKNAIRVDVNHLFSLSKMYAQKNENQKIEPHSIAPLSSMGSVESSSSSSSAANGKQQNATNRADKARNQVAVANHSASSSSNVNNHDHLHDPQRHQNRNAAKQVPRKLKYLFDNESLNFMKQFRREILVSLHSVATWASSYSQKKTNYIYTIILRYFAHLERQLAQKDVTYLSVIDSSQFNFDDFFSYGSRFYDYIQYLTQRFPADMAGLMDRYTAVKANYEKLFPHEILNMREKLLAMKMKLVEQQKEELLVEQQKQKQKVQRQAQKQKSQQQPQPQKEQQQSTETNIENDEAEAEAEVENCPVTFDMVTYRRINAKRLYQEISQYTDVRDQIEHFVDQVRLTADGINRRDQFVEHLDEILRLSELSQFGPRLHKFGSLTNGLSTYDSDLDIVIQFERMQSDILDYGTSMLMLEVIEIILRDRLRHHARETIVPSKRCPIIKLNFGACFPHFKKMAAKSGDQSTDGVEFNKCDISLATTYGVHNSRMLHFLTRYDRRFYEITMILKYWAKRNELIDTATFSTYGLTMLIIFFLQNTKPAVLPPIGKLQRLAQKQPGKSRVKIHRFNFEICDDVELVGASKNTSSTQELIIGFFKFYVNFDFFNFAISPRLGHSVRKTQLRHEKLSKSFDGFNISSYVCIEDPFVLEHNVGYSFRARNMNRWNALLRAFLAKATPKNCIKLLIDPANFDLRKSSDMDFINLPFSLACYELRMTPEFEQRPLAPNSISLKPIAPNNAAKSVLELLGTMSRFYAAVISHILGHCFLFPYSAYRVEPLPGIGLECSIDFGYLAPPNQRIHTRQYVPLLDGNRGKRGPDIAKRCSLLKMLRDDLLRQVRDGDQRRPTPNHFHDRWFRLEVFHHEHHHRHHRQDHSQMNKSSNKDKMSSTSVNVAGHPVELCLYIRHLTPLNTQRYNVSAKFAFLLQFLLQQFSFLMDRPNPEAAFLNLVNDFFSN